MASRSIKKIVPWLLLGILAPWHAYAGIADCEALIQTLIRSDIGQISHRSTLQKIEDETAKGSLIDFQEEMKTSAIRAHNRRIESALREPIKKSQPNTVGEIGHKEANNLVRLITEHPTNGARHEKKFDPDECYGFCFGRAVLVHSEALRRGVDPEAMKKIWAVGPLERGKWHFHVATLLKARSPGTWWAADPIYKNAINVQTWMGRMKNGADDDRLMFFVTDPRRFSVYDPRFYSALDLLGDGESDYYRGYFKAYLEHTAQQPLPAPFR